MDASASLSPSTFDLRVILMSDIVKKDTSTLVNIGIGATKVGALALALLNKDPAAGLAAAGLAELIDILSEPYKVRAAEFIHSVHHKIHALPLVMQERYKQRVSEPDGEQFFETAWRQAAETIDPEKREAIAALVKNGLTAEDLDLHHAHWLLRLLDQLDSVELILLQAHTRKFRSDPAFWERHETVLAGSQPPKYPRGAYSHSYPATKSAECREQQARHHEQQRAAETQYQLDREKHALYISRIGHLVETGLLGNDPLSHSEELQLTPLATALLKIADLADDDEWGAAEQANAAQVLQRSRQMNANLQSSIADKEKQFRRDVEKGATEFISELKRAARRRS